MAAEDTLFPDTAAPVDTPAPAAVAARPTPEDLFSGMPDTPAPISPFKDAAQGVAYGLPSQMKARLRALASAVGDQQAAQQLAPQPITDPNVNPESPYFKGGQAAGALAPDIAGMVAAPEAALPALVGEGLVTGPQEADDLNSYIRAAKAAAPNDPNIQGLKEVDPGMAGLSKAATAAIFARIAPALSSAGIELPVSLMAGEKGALGTVGRALQTPVGGAIARTAANTVGNMAVGDVLERATNPNYQPPKTATDVALAALPAAAFGALGAAHEAPPTEATPNLPSSASSELRPLFLPRRSPRPRRPPRPCLRPWI